MKLDGWVQILPLTGTAWVDLFMVLGVLMSKTSYRAVLKGKRVRICKLALGLEQSKLWTCALLLGDVSGAVWKGAVTDSLSPRSGCRGCHTDPIFGPTLSPPPDTGSVG